MNIEERILTLEEAKQKGYCIEEYNNGDYLYIDSIDNNDIEHLVRNGKEIAQGRYLCSYDNMFYQYTDKNNISHLMKEGKEIIKGKSINPFDNGDFEYIDENDNYHYCKLIDGEIWEKIDSLYGDKDE